MAKSYQFQLAGNNNILSQWLVKISLNMKLSFIFLVFTLNVLLA